MENAGSPVLNWRWVVDVYRTISTTPVSIDLSSYTYVHLRVLPSVEAYITLREGEGANMRDMHAYSGQELLLFAWRPRRLSVVAASASGAVAVSIHRPLYESEVVHLRESLDDRPPTGT